MNHTFTFILTIVVIGGLTGMGLAGTAAASDTTDTSSDGATATAIVEQDQAVEQSNTATVDQHVDQQAESGDSGINIEIDLDDDGNGGPGTNPNQ